ncbi:MAG: adenosylmethionine decarboxylase [Sandaracinaceae bacterium]|nr:adenosylmethionine decarboxylase [Sandaracinaceae bacterium]
MQTRGRHLILDFWGCQAAALNDAVRLEAVLRECALATGASVVGAMMHAFAPQGVTGVLLLEESHVSIHTWPERGYAAVDFYTCGSGDPEKSKAILTKALSATSCEVRLLARGIAPVVSPVAHSQ